MQVIFTPLAERQLQSLYDYVLEHSGEQRAAAYIGRIVAACMKLEFFPERGTRHDEILEGLRTMGFERRITIAFMVTPDRVLIEGVFYGGQDFERILRGEA